MSGYTGGSTGGGGTETTTTLGALISGATSKATPVDADNVCITDSAASHITKKLTWANLKATLKAYFDTLYVALTGDQNIDGVKTFLQSPIIPHEEYDEAAWNGKSEPPTKTAVRDVIVNVSSALAAKADDSAVVHDTGDEAVAGVKTFSSSPVVPAPTTDLQAATKKYVDDAVTAGGGYTDEAAQDAVGSILVDSAEIDFTYSDATPSITASIVAGSIDETKLDASVNASLAGELTANTQTGTTYSLVVGDKGKEVRTTNAAAKTVTVDPTSGLTTGFVCIVGNYGAGALTIAPGSGVTLRGYLWKVPQYGKAAIRAIGTDEFIVDILPNEAMVTLTDGATVTIDPKLGKRHYLSTANSRTIANGTAGLYDGQPLTVKILNSSGGSVTPTFDTGASNKFRFNGTLTVASAIAAGKTRYWTCSYNTADTRWDILAESGEF